MATFGTFTRLAVAASVVLVLSRALPIDAQPNQSPLKIAYSSSSWGDTASECRLPSYNHGQSGLSCADDHTARMVSDQREGISSSDLLAATKIFVTVFVTSQRYTGNLVKEANDLDPAPDPPFNEYQGLEAGDFICNSHANGAGLWGNFAAWLSKDGVAAKDRLTRGSGPFIAVNGLKIADNIKDLTDGNLDAPIVLDELGLTIVEGYHLTEDFVWTGTGIEGAAYDGGHCNGWAHYAELDQPAHAAVGRVCDDCLADWTFSDFRDCNWKVLGHLYCFQVMPAPDTNPPS